jgi:hypothetical protein
VLLELGKGVLNRLDVDRIAQVLRDKTADVLNGIVTIAPGENRRGDRLQTMCRGAIGVVHDGFVSDALREDALIARCRISPRIFP